MGVYFDKRRGKFIARQTVEGKRVYLGQFDKEVDAAIAYAKAQLFEEMKNYFTLENAKVDFCDSGIAPIVPHQSLRIARGVKGLLSRVFHVKRKSA